MLTLPTLLLLACSSTTRTRVEPSFVNVAITSGSLGTEASPLAFSPDPVSYGLTVTTSDVNGEDYAFNGDLNLRVRPGKFSEDPVITLVDGTWSGTIHFEDSFGPTRIWATDEGDRDEDSTRVPTFAAGVSPTIYFDHPTISEMQTSEDIETNQLDGEFAELRVADRRVVVTARDASGFWASDLLDAPGSGNSVYVYTFNRPGDDYAVGAQLSLLNGIDQEYLASTQFSWPVLEATTATFDVPAAVELSGCDDQTMEGLEGSRVVVTGGKIPDTFVEGSAEYQDFLDYAQWPLSYGSCTVYVESGSTAQDFFPTEHVGETIGSVSGMLKQVFSIWVLVVVDEADIASGPNPPPAAKSRTPAKSPTKSNTKLRSSDSRRHYYPEFK
jgi:hypothetical protein